MPAMKPIIMQFAITETKLISTYHQLFAKYSNDKCKLTGKFFKVSLDDFCCKESILY